VRHLLRIVIALMGLCPVVCLAADPLPRSVLVITQSSPISGGAAAMIDAFGSALNVNSSSRVALYTEHLDLNRFPSPLHRQLMRNFLREKYRETPIGVVVVDGQVALELVLSWRGVMWSEVPVVFSRIDATTAEQLKLPPNVTGFIAHRTLRDMVNAARLLVPGLKRVVLVGDPPERDAYRQKYSEEIATLATEVEFVDLTGLPVDSIKERVVALPNDTAVLYTAIFIDGAGVVYTPQSALRTIAEVSNRPIVTDTESQLGYGAVGGFVASITSAAREAAGLAVRILDGENASHIPVVTININKPTFDWRELKRWNIAEQTLPPGSEVRFREPTAWDRYRAQILAICGALLVQAALIGWLIYENRRRHLAEVLARHSMAELNHMNRVATAGELSASIAHEINQPLTGIVLRASAARRWLAAERPDIDKLRDALDQIEAAGHRASDIITSVKSMFRKDTQDKSRVDINKLIWTVLGLVYIDLRKHQIDLDSRLDDQLPPVLGNQVQLQQVILNLVMNAIDAMRSVQPRALSVRSKLNGHDSVQVSIEDTGVGIDPANLDQIFKPLFTTKDHGMGMGLSICHSIIEGHEGRIWVTAGNKGGTIFHFELPQKPSGTTKAAEPHAKESTASMET
jgi:signal transduction histidine kinase